MKNDIDVVEWNNLNIINKAFECLWTHSKISDTIVDIAKIAKNEFS